MNFCSFAYGGFLAALWVLLRGAKSEEARKNLLLFFSLLFYAYWDIRFLPLLLLLAAGVWRAALRLERAGKAAGKRTLLAVGVSCVLGVLCAFKYDVFSRGGLRLSFPLGLSFFSFEAISYLVDVYRGELAARRSYRQVLFYLSFFPTVVSGPIVKASRFFSRLDGEHRATNEGLREGGLRFLTGLFKKLVIADRLGVCVDAVFQTPAAYDWLSLFCAALAYSLQLYCDFSGYADMAIGSARMIGYALPENFNLPYLSESVGDFWRRWHMSLSGWFRDYVYIPCGGSRRGRTRLYLNLLLVMLLSGLWHGNGAQYLIWGGLHGAALVLERLFAKRGKLPWRGAARLASTAATFLFVTAAWIFFRARDCATALTIFGRIARRADGARFVSAYLPYALILVFAAGLFQYRKNGGNARPITLNLHTFAGKCALLFALAFLLTFLYAGNTAFLYAGF